jgi:two-component system response regulator AtoC
LNVIEIVVPPLRERREEIPILIDHFLRQFNTQFGRSLAVSPEIVHAFVEYSWPGNIRELENAVKRIVVLGTAKGVPQELESKVRAGSRAVAPISTEQGIGTAVNVTLGLKDIARQAARDAEREAIKDMLDRVHWNRTKAARLLHISYKALLYKIVQCGLASPDTEQAVA